MMYSYIGAIHIHSKYSDGTGDINVISKAAKKAGLDWIIITDHNCLNVEEGFYNGVLVIKGEELGNKTYHYLALDTDKEIKETDPKKYVEEVRNQCGFGFAAHPDESEKRKNIYPPIKWLDKSITPDGIEIWNWFSNWADNLNDRNILALIYAYLFKYKLITKPTKETLEWWDELNNQTEKIVPAIAGIDVHALKIKKYIIPVTIFPYKEMFKTFSNIISLNTPLSDDFLTAKQQVLNAVKSGNNLMVNRKICKVLPKIYIKNLTKSISFEKSLILDEQTFLSVNINKQAQIRIIKDGKVFTEKKANSLDLHIIEQGKYRVEIIIGNRGYAYSNPIYLYKRD